MPQHAVPTPRQQVFLVALGPLNNKVDLEHLASLLNKHQLFYRFDVLSSLQNLPYPAIPRPGNNLPAFHPDQLFEYMEEKRRSAGGDVLLAGVIDSEVHDDLYSTSDRFNRACIVSLRTDNLAEVIAESGKTYEQYVALELAAQLLSIQFRRAAGISADPCACVSPWHEERLNCLFDYYGLTSGNVTKLIEARLSSHVVAEMEAHDVAQDRIEATMSIVNRVTGRHFRETIEFVLKDRATVLVIGGLTGMLASQAVELPGDSTLAVVIVVLLGIAIRGGAFWLRGK